MAERSNRDRAYTGEEILDKYKEICGDEEAPYSQHLSDMISDLMHFCDGKGISFLRMLDRGRGHYDAEVAEHGKLISSEEHKCDHFWVQDHDPGPNRGAYRVWCVWCGNPKPAEEGCDSTSET